MTLSNAEQAQKDNFGPTKEHVQRLTLTPLDSLWIAQLEGSIEHRLVGYIDNHNTAVRRLDIILLPGEYLMITRNEKRGVIPHVSKQVFKINQKNVVETTNYPSDTVFKKVDTSRTYCGDMNQRFLNTFIGEDNLVQIQPLHRPMSFVMTDTVRPDIFKAANCYRTDGETIELVRPSEWNEEWEEGDNAAYAFIPFTNVTSFAILLQDKTKHTDWAVELIKALEKEGIYVDLEYKGAGPNNKPTPTRYNIHYPLPEQLFNVK